jgi:hypothetical protein
MPVAAVVALYVTALYVSLRCSAGLHVGHKEGYTAHIAV